MGDAAGELILVVIVFHGLAVPVLEGLILDSVLGTVLFGDVEV